MEDVCPLLACADAIKTPSIRNAQAVYQIRLADCRLDHW